MSYNITQLCECTTMAAIWEGIKDASPNPKRVWFCKLKDTDPWEPLQNCDCTAINDCVKENKTEVIIEFGRSTVHLDKNEISYSFYSAPPRKLRSAVWFHKLKNGKHDKLVPITSTHDEMLIEQYYVNAKDDPSKSEEVALTDDKGHKVALVKVKNMLSLRLKPTSLLSLEGHIELQRGYGDYTVPGEIEEAALGPIRHLSFVVHGIGEAMWNDENVKISSLLESVRQMRLTITKKLYDSWKKECNRCEKKGEPSPPPPNRIEFIPLEWYDKIHASNSALKNNLVSTTLNTIPKLRAIANDVIFDVLMYMTPEFCDEVLNCVTDQIIELYDLFKTINTDFSDEGTVSLIGHSLGSVIMWDMLSLLGHKLYQKEAAGTPEDPICLDDRKVKSYCLPEDPSMQSADTYRMNENHSGIEISTTGGTWGPSTARKIRKSIPFVPKFTMFLGSPLGLFLTLRSARPVFDNMRLAEEDTTEAGNHVDACLQPSTPFTLPSEAVYNIFHPSDPVAYRIEPLLLPPDVEDSDLPKPCFLKLDGERARLNTQIEELGDTLVKNVESFSNLFGGNIFDKIPSQRSIAKLTENLGAKGNRKNMNGHAEYDFALGGSSSRVDFQLQKNVVDSEYISAVTAHSSYFTNDDLLNFIIQCAHKK